MTVNLSIDLHPNLLGPCDNIHASSMVSDELLHIQCDTASDYRKKRTALSIAKVNDNSWKQEKGKQIQPEHDSLMKYAMVQLSKTWFTNKNQELKRKQKPKIQPE